ncbi:MAG TPA: outer membrane lipoprotein-sorting protein [Candidatus Eisenbacteria bacterium]|nr:outer membrane lipoprotein-sorting protein [Candidatus Eisenbacteria bacterium]
MFRKTLLALTVGLALASVANAQSLDDILAKHYQAVGGLDKLKAMKTVKMTGKMSMGAASGMEMPFTMMKKRPAKQRIEFTFSGMTGVRAFDGDMGWSLTPFQGKKDPEPMSAEETRMQKDDADFDGELVDWKAKGSTVELMGKESVDGADAWKLKVTKKSGTVDYDYLDADTYLLVKSEGKRTVRGTEVEGETSFGDYKDVHGYMMPFTLTSGIKDSPQKQTLTFDTIEVDVPLDDALFTMPATAAADSSKAAGAKAADKKDDSQKK